MEVSLQMHGCNPNSCSSWAATHHFCFLPPTWKMSLMPPNPRPLQCHWGEVGCLIKFLPHLLSKLVSFPLRGSARFFPQAGWTSTNPLSAMGTRVVLPSPVALFLDHGEWGSDMLTHFLGSTAPYLHTFRYTGG